MACRFGTVDLQFDHFLFDMPEDIHRQIKWWDIVMAYIVMAHIAMAYKVMAYIVWPADIHRQV